MWFPDSNRHAVFHRGGRSGFVDDMFRALALHHASRVIFLSSTVLTARLPAARFIAGLCT
jgi:hypothetical protein